MTVYCLEQDAENVERQLLDDFFAGNSTSLANIKVEVLEPTPEEEREACDSLDLILEDEIDPSEWTVEDCVNFIETTFGKSILVGAMHEISNDDV
jgi:nucleoside-triphosphatase THEP1